MSLLFTNRLEQYQGATFRVDANNGNDQRNGSNWTNQALLTPNAAIAKCVNGRGDRVYVAGAVNVPIVLNKTGVALVFMPGCTVNPGAGNTGILVTAGCLIYAPTVTSGRIGIHLDGINNVTVLRGTVNGIEPNGGDGICYFLDSDVGNYSNNFVECMALGDGDEYGWVLSDNGIYHSLNYCVAYNCLSGIKCLAGNAGSAHHINRFSFEQNTTQIEQVDGNHDWKLKECYFSDNPDTTGDGFGDIIPFPSSGFVSPDYYPIGDVAGLMATMMTNKDDLAKDATVAKDTTVSKAGGTKGTDNIYDNMALDNTVAKEGADGDDLKDISDQIDLVAKTGADADTLETISDQIDTVEGYTDTVETKLTTIEGKVDLIPTAGEGSVVVDHNYGGSDNLRIADGDGNGIDNAFLYFYLKTDYDAGNRGSSFIKARTVTDVNGRFEYAVRLDPSTYSISVEKSSMEQELIKEVTVA